MDSEEDSPLSSAPENDIELEPEQPTPKKSLNRKRKRPESPAREPTLADTFEIAFLVNFMNKFADCFKGAPSIGCQDIEQGIVTTVPSDKIEYLLCRLLYLILNRKKPVERGSYNRALEEAITSNKSQWPSKWEGVSPLSGGKTFEDFEIMKRLDILRTLVLWSLSTSEQVRGILSTYYKPGRKSGDINNPLAVQIWGLDGFGRRYYIVEGTDDTKFRVFRENPAHLKTVQWYSVAGNLQELNALAAKLDLDGSTNARMLRAKILQIVPRLEEGEKKRQRREYRQSRKAAWSYQSGMSLYEGRTRGKRIKYNYSSDESGVEGGQGGRSRRRPSEQPEGPQFTASGRQVRKPGIGGYGETGSIGSTTNGNSSRRSTRNSREVANGTQYSGEDPDTQSTSAHEDYNGTDADDESDEPGSPQEKRGDRLLVTLKVGAKLSGIVNRQYKNQNNGTIIIKKAEWRHDVLAPDVEKENTPPTPASTSASIVVQETG